MRKIHLRSGTLILWQQSQRKALELQRSVSLLVKPFLSPRLMHLPGSLHCFSANLTDAPSLAKPHDFQFSVISLASCRIKTCIIAGSQIFRNWIVMVLWFTSQENERDSFQVWWKRTSHHWFGLWKTEKALEIPGFEPGAFRMQSGRASHCAISPDIANEANQCNPPCQRSPTWGISTILQDDITIHIIRLWPGPGYSTHWQA